MARRAGCTGRVCVAYSSWDRYRSRSCSWSVRVCSHGATATLPAAIWASTERNVLNARITLSSADYPERAQAAPFFEEFQSRLRALPGVTSVGSAQGTPMSGWNVRTEARIEGAPPPKRGEELDTHVQYVTPSYFQTIGVGLVKGRWLNET